MRQASQSDPDGLLAALREGADADLVKQVNPEVLRLLLGGLAERRQAERKLAESEARQRALLNAIPDAIFRLSRDGTVLDVQAHRNRGLNARAESIIGSKVDQSPMPGPVIEKLQRGIERALASDEVQSLEYYLRDARGKRHFEARVVKSGEDEVVAIVRDTTVQKRAEERVLQGERLAAIGQMVAGLAHESRNALQCSQACLEMLAIELEDRPEALELVDRIQKAQNHLHHLYEEVRNYAAPIHLQRQVCNIAHVWRDTWTHLEAERRQKNVRLCEEVQDVPMTCKADPQALEQLFRNVVENAISACPEPGTIVIRCARTEFEGQEAIRIFVRDDGPGFSVEDRGRAFEPFFTTKTRGTGLGLPIARRIAEAHGGTIAIGDTTLPGAEIVVTLPCS